VLTAALYVRFRSRQQHTFAEKMLSAMRQKFGGHVEAGAAKRFDRLIIVTCSEEQRIARFAARHKVDLDAARKEVERRMAAQLPEAEKAKAADYVIDNSGSLDHTREQVQNVWDKLRDEAMNRH